MLNDEIKKLQGNVVCIGVNNKKLLKLLKSNNKIGLYELVRYKKSGLFSHKRRVKMPDGKSVKIKKFRRLFKKKSINHLLIDLNNIFDYYKYIAAKGTIIIYGESDYLNASLVAQKFRRYTKNITTKQNGNKYCVIVDASDTKYRWLKDKYYIIIDTFHNLGDFISYFLTS